MTDQMITYQKFQMWLEKFRQHSADMLQLVTTYPAERIDQANACGWWSPRQVMAHESGWLVELLRRYDLFDADNDQPVNYDFDAFNAKSVESRAGLDWDATIAEFRTLVEQTLRRAESLTPERAGTVKGYLNGVLYSTGTLPAGMLGVNTGINTRIGAPDFKGQLDDMRTYNRALTWSEVLDLVHPQDGPPY